MTDTGVSAPSIFFRFFQHLVSMPTWHRGVLMVAALLAGVGIVGHVQKHSTAVPAAVPAAPGDTVVSAPHNGFAADDSPAAPSAGDPNANPTPWYLSPQFLNVGGSVIGGFIIGWFARAFVKTVMLIALAGAGILAALSYFHVMNVDFTAANVQYTSAMNWVTDQASKLKDVAITYLPVHAAGAFGTFLGFKRR